MNQCRNDKRNDSGDTSMTLHEGGRYEAQWNEETDEWVGGIGWNPGGSKVVNYSGSFTLGRRN